MTNTGPICPVCGNPAVTAHRGTMIGDYEGDGKVTRRPSPIVVYRHEDGTEHRWDSSKAKGAKEFRVVRE